MQSGLIQHAVLATSLICPVFKILERKFARYRPFLSTGIPLKDCFQENELFTLFYLRDPGG